MAIKITLISVTGSGSGLNENTLLPDGAIVEDAVHLATGTRDDERWMAKVNGAVTDFEQELEDGDRVTVSPKKVEGA